MTGDDLGSIRYIGQRLRGWRHDRNWSGQDVAARLAARLGRSVEWPELRDYEEANALPDSRTANELATVYGRSLAELLTLSGRASAVPLEPWPPTVPSANDLEAVKQLLTDRGHDPRHAARLFGLGLSRGSAGAWMRKFEPEEAFGWIARRFGPSEAIRWADRGYTVEDAVRLKSLGMSPENLPKPVETSTDGALAIEVRVARDQLGLGGESIAAWTACDWDLLASIPWQLTGFEPAPARSWQQLGFDALGARALVDHFTPEEAQEWSATAIGSSEWAGWSAVGFKPPEAAPFAAAGYDAAESAQWRDAGLAAADAKRWTTAGFDALTSVAWREIGFEVDDASGYRAADLDAQGAAGWRSVGVAPADVRQWLDLDLEPSDARRWSAVSSNPSVMATLTRAGLTPSRSAQYLEVGIKDQDIERWHVAGFTPRQAGPWAGTSPERARRLMDKGISPDFDLSRRLASAQRVAAARDALAGPQAPRLASSAKEQPTMTVGSASTGFVRPASAPGCAACGRPIGVNGRCGCS